MKYLMILLITPKSIKLVECPTSERVALLVGSESFYINVLDYYLGLDYVFEVNLLGRS
jgi:hypothetical protein